MKRLITATLVILVCFSIILVVDQLKKTHYQKITALIEETEDAVLLATPLTNANVHGNYDTELCCFDRCSLGSYPLPKRITLRHVEGDGDDVSFGTNYSTLAVLFSPDYRIGHTLPMIDVRGHRFDNNMFAANVGLVTRYIPSEENAFCELLGFNVYYDWREGFKANYQQIGAGLEILGCKWDFRANGYIPIGITQLRTTCVFDDYDGDFFAIHRECEFTSYGFNAEVGYMAEWCDTYFLYVAGGPYYLARKCLNNTRGGELRIRPQYKDYIAVDLSVSYDNVFHTVFQAQIIVYLPLYQISSKNCRRNRCCCFTDRQIYQPVERFEVMPLGRRSCWERNF